MNYKHGFAKNGAVDPLHNRWRDIHRRCKHHKSYASRGIIVCDAWQDFVPFRIWALSTGYKPNLTLDRIDNDGPYAPNNCRWASARLQARNRRTSKYLFAKGRKQTVVEWSEETGVSQTLIGARIKRLGWDIEKAIFTPPYHKTSS